MTCIHIYFMSYSAVKQKKNSFTQLYRFIYLKTF